MRRSYILVFLAAFFIFGSAYAGNIIDSYRYGAPAPPAGDVIETFEGNPLMGVSEWYITNGSLSAQTRSTSNVTQGTYSWRLESPIEGFRDYTLMNYGPNEEEAWDLSDYETIKVDVYVAEVPSGGDLALGVTCEDGTENVASDPFTSSGSATIQVDVSGITRTECNIYIAVAGSPIGDDIYDVYWDNLRGEF